MNKNIKKYGLLLILLLSFMFQYKVYATSLTLEVTANKEKYVVGDSIEYTVNWTSEMHAMQFDLSYNKDTLQYVSSSLNDENFVNNSEPGVIHIAWAGEEGLTNCSFTFKAINEGEGNVNISSIICFAEIIVNGEKQNIVPIEQIDYTTTGNAAVVINNSNNIKYGDVNGDNFVNKQDAIDLRNYLAESISNVSINKSNSDLNIDGKINLVDLKILIKHLLNENDYNTLPFVFMDYNNDGYINASDSAMMASYLSDKENFTGNVAIMDLNFDGIVNVIDKQLIKLGFGKIDISKFPIQTFKEDVNNLTRYFVKDTEDKNTPYITGFNNDKLDRTVEYVKNTFIDNLSPKIYNKTEEIKDVTKIVGTGNSIKVKYYTPVDVEDEDDKEIVGEYIAVIYGDCNGDGEINAIDALTVIKHANKKVIMTNNAYIEASKIIDDTPSAIDALAIIKHANNKIAIDQFKGRTFETFDFN